MIPKLSICLPVIATILLVSAFVLWIKQPFVDHSPANYDYEFHEQISGNIKVYSSAYTLRPDTRTGKLYGSVTMEYSVRSASEEWFRMNSGYSVSDITVDGNPVPYETIVHSEINGERKTVFTPLSSPGFHTLVIEYEGFPTIARCQAPFGQVAEISDECIFLINEGTGPFSTSFLKCENSDWELILPTGLTPVVDHHIPENPIDNHDGTSTWHITASGYVTPWILAADFTMTAFEAAGLDIDLIYSRKYEQNIIKYRIPATIADVMDYCTKHIGRLTYEGDGRLTMLQRSAGGGNASFCPRLDL